MKKCMAVIMAFTLLVGLMTGCAAPAGAGNEHKLKIVTTIFPEYDWVRNILGERAQDVELTLLLDNGVDLHSYQPSTEDIITISTCDVFIYVGGHSDSWVDDALKNAANPDMTVIALFDVLADVVKEEEYMEGMEHDHDHEHEEDHDDGHDHEEEHTHEDDEHVWLSLKNAKTVVSYLAQQMASADPEYADVYAQNGERYIGQLEELDRQYQTAVEHASVDTLLFADRFPFRYLVDDYGLNYYAAFSGCSAESEASFETIAFLAGKVEQLGLHSVLTTENATHKIAQTVIDNTKRQDQRILVMDSMQSITAQDVANGITYLDIMQSNLDVLKQALG